jgi:hypothetical protein
MQVLVHSPPHSDSVGLGWGLRICIFNKHSIDFDWWLLNHTEKKKMMLKLPGMLVVHAAVPSAAADPSEQDQTLGNSDPLRNPQMCRGQEGKGCEQLQCSCPSGPVQAEVHPASGSHDHLHLLHRPLSFTDCPHLLHKSVISLPSDFAIRISGWCGWCLQ